MRDESKSRRRRRRHAWAASLLVHVALCAVAYPATFKLDQLADKLVAIDLSLLGARGGVSWAEVIGLTTTGGGGKDDTELKARQDFGQALRVEIVFLPHEGSDIFSKNKPTDSSSAKNDASTREDVGKKKQKQEDKQKAKADNRSSAPASAEARAKAGIAQNIKKGKDIGGRDGKGGSDKQAEGQFVAGNKIKKVLSGWTFIGTNGYADGSRPNDRNHERRPIRWEVYYSADGTLSARFFKVAANRPHGPLALREIYSSGRWWVKGNWLCQSIAKWSYGGEVCFEVRQRQNKFVALYYTSCWGVSRCYEGRLGSRGAIYEGNRLD